MSTPDVDVVVIGGGPAGLAAAVELRRLGIARVALLDRESALGGTPRHCHHTGFGLLDLQRMLSGPRYAEARVTLARDARIEILANTTALALTMEAKSGLRCVSLTGPGGTSTMRARGVVLATGCRERPRSARLVPGARPSGVLTTGSLQQLVYGRGARVGRRAVVVGAEHVSFSAVHTLAAAGVETACMVTPLPEHQTVPLAAWLVQRLYRAPLRCGVELAEIRGRRRVQAVLLRGVATGREETVECDTVVFTGDWIPDHELARTAGLTIDEDTRGPRVDQRLRTSAPLVYAAGNLLRGAEIADVAALEGMRAARGLRDELDGVGPASPADATVPIRVDRPLLWIAPNAITRGSGAPPRDRFVLRSARFIEGATLVVAQTQDGRHRELYVQPCKRLVPNRPIALDASWCDGVRDDIDTNAGPLTVSIRLEPA